MDKERNQEPEVEIAAEWDVAPTLLGAVAGTLTKDMDVLTGSVCGCTACDVSTDYARA
jgi:hypothetical protein